MTPEDIADLESFRAAHEAEYLRQIEEPELTKILNSELRLLASWIINSQSERTASKTDCTQ